MNYPHSGFAALISLLLLSPTHAADWKQADGPLKTRWAKDVTPANALPEYPRPQMVREDWLNLNGLWDIKLGDSPETKILVPYPIESALSGVMKHADRMTYRRSFEVPKAWGTRQVLLHFGAVDWQTKVSLNGKLLGVHRGGYDTFSFDITAALNADGAQQLSVEVFDPTDLGGQPRGKQTMRPGGIMYTPTSGIWQTVWLEPVAKAHIDSLHLIPDLDGSCLRLTVAGSGTVEAVASDDGKPVATISGAAGSELKLAIPSPKLWSPASPHLYDLRVTLKSGDQVVDSVTSYFGMRKIALGKDEQGVTRLMLNGKFVFQVGPLDQGFWPDGIYTAPTDEALRWDVAEMRRLGFNCARKHIKVEPDRWYYWCDKLGLMVWQDMPSVNSYTDKPQPIDVPQFQTELTRLVRNHWNHPSIILWVIFNEAQGQHDTEALVATVKALDPSRLVNNASGGDDKKCGDVIDMHNYPGPGSPKPEAERAAVLGEFGGLGLAVDGHRWAAANWGYKGTQSMEALTRAYEKLLVNAWRLKDSAGLSAVIYTQITDVETECNGLLTYDREVNKVLAGRAAAVNSGNLPPQPVIKQVVPTSQQEGINWRFTFDAPAADWIKSGFSDAAWKEGPGGFGTAATPGAVVRSEWKTADIWLRRSFEWTAVEAGVPALFVHHDEDVEIYINGVLAGKADGFTSDYEEMTLTPEGLAALHPGSNVFAVHCHQVSGGQYIDVGIITETAPSK
ncbi:MAG: glycoside hydrolase family 2 TIM barrel-domain containing protein [Verrucomicrobiota bacterium]